MKISKSPLQARAHGANETTIVGAASGMKGPIMAVANNKPAKTPAPRLTGEDLEEFKEAVDGSNLTKVELQKALKKRYLC